MANLIPPQAQKIVRREYLARVVALWLLLVAIAVVLVTLLFIPVYVLIENQTEAYAGEFVEAEGQSDQFTSISATITQTNSLATSLLEHGQRPVAISTYLAVVMEAAPAGIDVNLFTVQGNTALTIGGTAKTRTQLAAYKEALEATDYFERVELPISALASERNIKFTMQLVPKVAKP